LAKVGNLGATGINIVAIVGNLNINKGGFVKYIAVLQANGQEKQLPIGVFGWKKIGLLDGEFLPFT